MFNIVKIVSDLLIGEVGDHLIFGRSRYMYLYLGIYVRLINTTFVNVQCPRDYCHTDIFHSFVLVINITCFAINGHVHIYYMS
jgi:hypothetical protein